MPVQRKICENWVTFAEKHRPQFHFSAPENWINDPNGLVFFGGQYHLFYQYNPHGPIWGNMHWGHATSRDLIHWEHRPIAIYAGKGEHSFVFSGGAVVDFNNSSGLAVGDQFPALIAFFTHSGESGENQRQCIAYSVDGGEKWTEYPENPVIVNPGLKDFRDPNVHWDDARSRWVMSLAVGQRVMFYHSDNLLDWHYASEFGEGLGAQGGVWECPDIFELTADNGVKKHILIVSLNTGGLQHGSGTQYFVGGFDGNEFVPDQPISHWVDWGADCYAGITWKGAPGAINRRLFIAWMSNWQYANETPTEPWRGQMTQARSLGLSFLPSGQYKLTASPVDELKLLRESEQFVKAPKLSAGETLAVGEHDLLDMEFNGAASSSDTKIIVRFFNTTGERLELTVNFEAEEYAFDRRGVGFDSTGNDFSAIYRAPFCTRNRDVFDVRLLKDASSIELFAEEGRTCMTSLFYATDALNQIEIECVSGGIVSPELRYWPIRSIWNSRRGRHGEWREPVVG